jgi:hypothetical protein
MSRRLTSAVIVATALASGSIASADVSRAVISAFSGQFVVTKDELPEGKNDRDTITKIKAVQLKELVGNEVSSDNTAWHFHYTAFLTKTGSSALKLDFLREGGALSADKQLSDVDPKRNVLSGDISIDENEGLTKGKTYTIELLAGSSVVAKTTMTFK